MGPDVGLPGEGRPLDSRAHEVGHPACPEDREEDGADRGRHATVAVPGWKDSRHVVLRAVYPDPPFVREYVGPPGLPRPRLQRIRGDLRPKGRYPRRYDPDGRGLQRRHRATASAG